MRVCRAVWSVLGHNVEVSLAVLGPLTRVLPLVLAGLPSQASLLRHLVEGER